MSQKYEPKAHWTNKTRTTSEQYKRLYQESITSPETFWGREANRLVWKKPWTHVDNSSFSYPIKIEWFTDGELNVSENCVDRHALHDPNRIAIIWQPEDPIKPAVTWTYKDLLRKVCQMAAGLRSLGVKKGDRVTIYLPMIPETAAVMLACTRIGAVHSVVFGGFAPDALASRIQDAESEFLVTCDEGVRGGKTIPLKKNADLAADQCPHLKKILTIRHSGYPVAMKADRDVWWHEIETQQPDFIEPVSMKSQDPLFMLYTSGSTNKPKGVLHTTGGYLVYAAFTHERVFDYQPGEIYWCAADMGWITGHSYIVYGPLANGATTLIYEGLPTFPTPQRIWDIVDQHQVQILYTAPTLIRSLIQSGNSFLSKNSRKSLRLLGSVGEPINPEAWNWYFHEVGGSQCPVVDTYWQTETGGIMITPLPGSHSLKPGSATQPFFGVQPVLMDQSHQPIQGEGKGVLCFKKSWPGQMNTVYKDHERFYQTYFSQYPGYYFTGDGAIRDKDGDYWITGRVDDVINVSGHRLGTAEVESALVLHPKVAEAAAVGYPHDLKGQGLYVYVTLKSGVSPSKDLKEELIQHVRIEIGAFAKPDILQFAPQLPKTRSGKIMRRILRKIAENQITELGDLSTLADPQVVTDLIKNRESK